MTDPFLTPLVLDYIDGRTWQVAEAFSYHAQHPLTTITVPMGFITDFASIPRALWAILPPTGKYGKAAVIHDYLYNRANYQGWTKAMADRVFYDAMGELGVPQVQRWLMWQAVRMFGKGNFGNYPVAK
jgi:hypothetical protein